MEVLAVLEYRAAKEAQSYMNDMKGGMEKFAKNPALVQFWRLLLNLNEENDGD